jgi:hypothetical protein
LNYGVGLRAVVQSLQIVLQDPVWSMMLYQFLHRDDARNVSRPSSQVLECPS